MCDHEIASGSRENLPMASNPDRLTTSPNAEQSCTTSQNDSNGVGDNAHRNAKTSHEGM